MSNWRTQKKKTEEKPAKKVVASVVPAKPKIIEKKSKVVVEKKVNSRGDTRGTSKASLSNLTPGGPGRPKGKLNFDTRVDMAIEVLALKYVDDFNKKKENKNKQITLDDVDIEGDIFAQFINKARNGNERMLDSFLDRRHGKATQPIEMSGRDGNPIEYSVRLEEAKEKLKKNQSKWFKK